MTFTGRNDRTTTSEKWDLIESSRDRDVFALGSTAVSVVCEIVIINLGKKYQSRPISSE